LDRVDDLVHKLKRQGQRSASRSGIVNDAVKRHLPELERLLEKDNGDHRKEG